MTLDAAPTGGRAWRGQDGIESIEQFSDNEPLARLDGFGTGKEYPS
jgi:hypothetical protein